VVRDRAESCPVCPPPDAAIDPPIQHHGHAMGVKEAGGPGVDTGTMPSSPRVMRLTLEASHCAVGGAASTGDPRFDRYRRSPTPARTAVSGRGWCDGHAGGQRGRV